MATAKAGGKIAGSRPGGAARWLRYGLLFVVLVVALAVTLLWSRMHDAALARTAYGAQTGCLCRFVAGRTLDQCAADPGVAQDWVRLSEDGTARAVTASVPGLASQTARWTPESGCMLDAWKD
jgi:hypothetical protein